jgi:hypothetical protein
MRSTLLTLFIFSVCIPYTHAQFTETINSNRPGNSQGAFSVGTNIFQAELGAKIGKDDHSLLNYEADIFGVDAFLRYGVVREQLELSIAADFLSETRQFTTGGQQEVKRSNFDRITIGGKYLLYDPYKSGPEKPNIYSWKANNSFKWKSLIPAVSVYAGANLNLSEDNPFAVPDEGKITPRIELITQNNWAGGWVFVMNFVADKVTTDFPTYAGIFTLTHSFSPKTAGFLEYQAFKNDLYSDNIIRGGGAYLITKDLQIDLSGLFSFKDTPSRWQIGLGASYRINSRTDKDDMLLENSSGKNKDKDRGTKSKQKRKDTDFNDGK